MTQQRLEVVAHRLRALQRGVATQAFGQMATSHFQHRLQLAELGRAQPKMLAERGPSRLPASARRLPNSAKQMARQIHRAFARDSGAQKDSQQLGV
jgi:hypothetical protein